MAPAAISEILTVHPKQYRDAQVIAENFREGIPVIINLSQSNGTLILYAGPGRLKMPLLPTGGDSFSLSKTGTGPVVTFQVDNEGKAESVQIQGGRLFDLFGNNVLFWRTTD